VRQRQPNILRHPLAQLLGEVVQPLDFYGPEGIVKEQVGGMQCQIHRNELRLALLLEPLVEIIEILIDIGRGNAEA
jgi:hypothetical protein